MHQAFNEYDFSIALEHRLQSAVPGQQVRKLWTLENRGIVTWNQNSVKLKVLKGTKLEIVDIKN